MSTKVTLRLPDPVMERLRDRSRGEGRSLNETAVDAILRGLGQPPADEDWRILGPLVELPPAHRFDEQALQRAAAGLSDRARGVLDELDWVRGAS